MGNDSIVYENSGVGGREMTYEEYISELLNIQKNLGECVFNDQEEHRMNEIIVFLNKSAKARGVGHDKQFLSGMRDLQSINKEIAISMAGKNAEKRVANTLEYNVTRPCYRYWNIFLADEERETEIDGLVLTENGILILEVKSARQDITISESGRLLYGNDECFHDVSISEKMQTKRDLLRTELSRAIEAKGLNIPLRIDSLIVFSQPNGMFINVTDLCHKEKYCFRQKLPYIINEYCSDVAYSSEEIEALNSILCEMGTRKRIFKMSLDFNEIRSNVEKMIEMCTSNERLNEEKKEIVQENKEKKQDTKNGKLERRMKLMPRKRNIRNLRPVLESAASFALILSGVLSTVLAVKRL